MPHTLDRVNRIIDWLSERGVPPVTLLVVPGRPWTSDQIQQVRSLSDAGHPLAAHGWFHQTTPKRFYHRIHAALISRNVAEHLDLDSAGVLELLHKSKQWFIDNDLPAPDFYVPPAWALGPISKHDLQRAPYKLIETTRGLIHLNETQQPTFESLPLTGYEADTAFRECFLRRWNAYQEGQASKKKKPLRISIHPDDLELRVADQLEEQIEAATEFLEYR